MTAHSRTDWATRKTWHMLIDGQLVDASKGHRIDVVAPATGETFATIPSGGDGDADAAVAAALRAFPSWRTTPAAERGRMLLQLADAVEAHAEELARLDAMDNGSPVTMFRRDIVLASTQLRYFAGLALELKGQSLPTPRHGQVNYTTQEPFGVVARLVPYNHPLMFAATKIAAPLLAGNTLVLKPSEHTSLSALALGELCADIFPAGVVNVVTGTGESVGARLVEHPDVPRIAFTGSVATGLRIQRQAAAVRVKVVTLELGGKNPLIVFPDAVLDAAVAGAVQGMNFSWQGQSCGSTSRVFVHRSLWDLFLARVTASLADLRIGDPMRDDTDVGAVVNRSQYERIAAYIRSGIDDPRARLVTGSVPQTSSVGLFIEPAVFAFDDGDCDSPLLQEEIFGPVMSAVPFDDYAEVITAANRLRLGLTASVWTAALGTAMNAAQDLEAGYVWINASSTHVPGAPFGGTKNSGYGREEGVEELFSYAQQRNVFIQGDREDHSS